MSTFETASGIANRSTGQFVSYVMYLNAVTSSTERSKDKNQCDYPDIIAPIAFGVYEEPDLKTQAEQYFKVRWETIHPRAS